jgi:hypothetical protein
VNIEWKESGRWGGGGGGGVLRLDQASKVLATTSCVDMALHCTRHSAQRGVIHTPAKRGAIQSESINSMEAVPVAGIVSDPADADDNYDNNNNLFPAFRW